MIRVLYAMAAFGLFAMGCSGVSAAPMQTLTCTIVHGQCMQACGRQMIGFVCNSYCSGRKSECLTTGNWSGRFGDVFDSVVKR